jgi:hypothetical protein
MADIDGKVADEISVVDITLENRERIKLLLSRYKFMNHLPPEDMRWLMSKLADWFL